MIPLMPKDYRGYTIVVGGSGAAFIHQGSSEGPLVHRASSLEEAKRLIDGWIADALVARRQLRAPKQEAQPMIPPIPVEYRGYTLLTGFSGGVAIHEGTLVRTGPKVHQAEDEEAAKRWIDARPAKPKPDTEMVRAADLRIGDHVRLSEQLTVVLTEVGHVNLHPLLLTQLTFSEINGKALLTLPCDAQLPRVIRQPPMRRYRIIGQVFRCDGYDRVINARSEDEARQIAERRVNERYDDLSEFCINEVNELEDAP